MERARLQTLLAAGPSLCFSVLDISMRLAAEGRNDELLFKTPFLNRVVLLKHVDRKAAGRRGGAGRPIQMLVYLPYDPEQPGEGGEAMVYDRKVLRGLYAAKTGISGQGPDALQHDEALLEQLDALPALNPFLLRGIVEPALPAPYLELDEEAVARLRRRLERRVRPLIVAAFGTQDEEVGDSLQTMVDAFFEPASRHHLRGLGGALHLEEEEAEALLGAWTGIAFFEDEFAQLKPRVQAFVEQLVAASQPLTWLAAGDQGQMPERLATVRASMRAAWLDLRAILERYQASYDALVFDSAPHDFVTFLSESNHHYWRLAEICAQYEQAEQAWADRTSRYPDGRLPIGSLVELVESLEQLFPPSDADKPTPTARVAETVA